MRTAIFSLLLSVVLMSSMISNAQLGWQWGIASKHPAGIAPEYAGFDMQPSTMDKSGNLIAAGYCWGDTAIFGHDTIFNQTTAEALVVFKTDSNGNVLWAISTQHATCNAMGLATDTGGNIYVVGQFDSVSCTFGSFTMLNPSATNMLFIAKISPSGTVLWSHDIAPAYANTDQNLEVDSLGNAYVMGMFQRPGISIGSTPLITRGYVDVFVAKFDPSGTNIWAREFAGASFTMTGAMHMLNDQNLFFTGDFNGASMTMDTVMLTNPNPSNFCTFLAKIDSAGNIKSAKVLGNDISVNRMIHDTAANLYLTGDIDTNVIWGNDTLTTRGGSDMFLAKYDSAGHFKWARSAGSKSTDHGYGLSINQCGQIWVGGTLGVSHPSTIYFTKADSLTEPIGSFDPMFVAEYDTAGNYKSSIGMSGGGDDFVNMIANNTGSLYVLGDYMSYIIFGPDTLNASPAILENMFIAKYKFAYGATCPPPVLPLGVTIPETAQDVTIFPNPASGECTIHSDVPMAPGSKMELFDMTGRIIKYYSLSGTDQVISVSGITPGMYECRIMMSDGIVTIKKLVVMQ